MSPDLVTTRSGAQGERSVSSLSLSLAARAENVAVVRQVMGAVADALELPTRTAEDLRLAVTEACTNVVRHAYDSPDGRMDIEVDSRDARRLEVAVADRGRGLAASDDHSGPGLGLPMIAALVEHLEIDRTLADGSRISMTFARPAALS